MIENPTQREEHEIFVDIYSELTKYLHQELEAEGSSRFNIIRDDKLCSISLYWKQENGDFQRLQLSVSDFGILNMRKVPMEDEPSVYITSVEAEKYKKDVEIDYGKLPDGIDPDFEDELPEDQMEIFLKILKAVMNAHFESELVLDEIQASHDDISEAVANDQEEDNPRVVQNANAMRKRPYLMMNGKRIQRERAGWTISSPDDNRFLGSINLGRTEEANADALFLGDDEALIADGVGSRGKAGLAVAQLCAGFAHQRMESDANTSTSVAFLNRLRRLARFHPNTVHGASTLIYARKALTRHKGQMVKQLPDGGSIWEIYDTGDSRWYVIGANGEVIDQNEMHNQLGVQLRAENSAHRAAHVRWILDHTDRVTGHVDLANTELVDTIFRYTKHLDSSVIQAAFPGPREITHKDIQRVYCPAGASLYFCTDGNDDIIAAPHVGHLTREHGIREGGHAITRVIDHNEQGFHETHRAGLNPSLRDTVSDIAAPSTIVGFSDSDRRTSVTLELGMVHIPKNWAAPGPNGPVIKYPTGDHSTFGLLAT